MSVGENAKSQKRRWREKEERNSLLANSKHFNRLERTGLHHGDDPFKGLLGRGVCVTLEGREPLPHHR